jgi:hypothetical protein
MSLAADNYLKKAQPSDLFHSSSNSSQEPEQRERSRNQDSREMSEINVEKEKIDFARFINEHNLQLIGLVDTKASIIVGINGVILGLLSQSILGLLSQSTGTIIPAITSLAIPEQLKLILPLFWSSVILLGVSAICGLRTIFPRIRVEAPFSESMVFHQTITTKEKNNKTIFKKFEDKEFKEYEKEWEGLKKPKDILQQEILNAFRLADALKKVHFKYLRWSLVFLIIALIPLILFLLTITGIFNMQEII